MTDGNDVTIDGKPLAKHLDEVLNQEVQPRDPMDLLRLLESDIQAMKNGTLRGEDMRRRDRLRAHQFKEMKAKVQALKRRLSSH